MILSTKAKDITGQKFNKLTVLSFAGVNKYRNALWLCLCECGKNKIISGCDLRKGHSKSCGCNQEAHDLSSQQFGKLTVLYKNHINKTKKNTTHYWYCICECGNNKIVDSGSLLSGNVKSCGCIYRSVLIGNKYGYLTVIKNLGRINDIQTYNCLCQCGAIISIPGSNLTSGNSKSCGCIRRYNFLHQRFGKLTVISRNKIDGKFYWKCQCDCGNIIYRESYVLRTGHIRSCGCLLRSSKQNKENINKINKNLSRSGFSKQYNLWRKNILVRDGYQCVLCKSIDKLHVHHLNSYSQYEEERFLIENGTVLCEDCHVKFHKKYGQITTKEMFEEYRNDKM